ncbi:hypothetical protein DVH24_018120 [Malus domestica]|uniref:Uncharacterized protein n=1 Tax=Malus domestica TaxID=3750 RepID=A0A498KEP0_MALDO|nr:hypothetical protein DVH24_018120 [Malus domestica]
MANFKAGAVANTKAKNCVVHSWLPWCYKLFLREQIDFYEKELEITNRYLAIYRELKQKLDS